MSAEIVNLRRARKAKARDQAADKAQQNRALHGRTSAETKETARETARIDRIVDGAKRDRPKD